jgi:outer membrane receptor protein involved in Fe transport
VRSLVPFWIASQPSIFFCTLYYQENNVRTLIRAALASLIAMVVFVGPVSAATNSDLMVAQAIATGTITGTITSDSGSGVASATVVLDGPQRQTTTTDGSGAFSVTVAPGVYAVTVTKAGYQTGSSQVTVAPSTTVSVDVALSTATLSNLNVIGRTSSNNSGNAAKFNVSSSPVQSLSQTQILIRNTPDLTSVLQELPGITIPRATSNPNQSFIIHGLRYETKTEIDGHPVSSGTGGTFLTNYTPAAIFGSVQTAWGGGLIGPESGSSGVGIVSLNTPDFSAKDSAFLQGGLDSYGGSIYTLLADINVGNKLQFVLGRAFSGYRGPTYGTNQADYTGATPPIGTGAPANLSNGVVQYIADFSDTYALNAELAKMRYSFSNSTSFSAEFLGLQGGFNPQGGAYGQYVGLMTIPQCINKNVAGNGAGCTVTSEYNSPAAQPLIGQTIPGYAFYPGSFVAQNQPNFNAELRTTIGNDTLLLRPYTAAIRRLIDGTQESDIPGDAGGGWYQVTNTANCQANFVAAAAGVGAKGPCFAGGANPIAAYVGSSNTYPVTYATTNTAPICNATTPCYTSATGLNNSGQVGFGSPYTTLEVDQLAGYTFSYIHPFGANTFNLTFDHYYDDAIDYINDASPLAAGCTFVLGSGVANTAGTPAYQSTCPLATLRPSPLSVPETFSSISSLGGAATFQVTPKLEVDAGLYFTHYLINAQALNNTAYNAYLASLTPAQSSYAGGFPVQLSGVQNSASHMDPRFGLVYRPERDWSIRFNAGSSLSIPYAGLVSGFTTYQQGATSITQSTPNPNLLPEELVTMDLGSSYRTPDGTVLSGDIYNTVVHNPWINPKVQICSTNITCASVFPGLEATTLGYTSLTVNGAQQYAQGIEFTIANEPLVGFGYRVNTSFERLYYLDTNPAYLPGPAPGSPLGAPQVFFNGNQFTSTGSGGTSVPYSKAYAEVQYAASNQSLFRIGADYEGPNNEYNAPAFWIFDAGVRVNSGFHNVMIGASVENLMNLNFNSALGRGVEYAGLTPVAATAAPGGYAYSTGTFNTALVSPGPVTFRFTLTKQF